MKNILVLITLAICTLSCSAQQSDTSSDVLNHEQLREKLTKQEAYVLLDNGTERPFTGEYDKHFEDGIYKCVGCANPLYSSETKYDSGSGWPAFWAPIEGNVAYTKDRSHGMVRTEVHCAKCGGHLGHVFNDGPKDETGKRHCINSVVLEFVEN